MLLDNRTHRDIDVNVNFPFRDRDTEEMHGGVVSPLGLAVWFGRDRIVKHMFSLGLGGDWKLDVNGSKIVPSPLSVAIYVNQKATFKTLLENEETNPNSNANCWFMRREMTETATPLCIASIIGDTWFV